MGFGPSTARGVYLCMRCGKDLQTCCCGNGGSGAACQGTLYGKVLFFGYLEGV